MPRYAYFDPSTPEPRPVLGWYDTDALYYPNLPAADHLLQMTDEQWDGRMDTPMIKGGTLVKAPPLPPPTPSSITYKADIWRRCSESEAEILDAALEQAPSRLRRLFDGVAYLDTADPDYPMIRDAISAALGSQRAAEILAPS